MNINTDALVVLGIVAGLESIIVPPRRVPRRMRLTRLPTHLRRQTQQRLLKLPQVPVAEARRPRLLNAPLAALGHTPVANGVGAAGPVGHHVIASHNVTWCTSCPAAPPVVCNLVHCLLIPQILIIPHVHEGGIGLLITKTDFVRTRGVSVVLGVQGQDVGVERNGESQGRAGGHLRSRCPLDHLHRSAESKLLILQHIGVVQRLVNLNSDGILCLVRMVAQDCQASGEPAEGTGGENERERWIDKRIVGCISHSSCIHAYEVLPIELEKVFKIGVPLVVKENCPIIPPGVVHPSERLEDIGGAKKRSGYTICRDGSASDKAGPV
mmetsp:Transcript_1132/g.2368  ORF Transcript_1132/g.2368 Transcript_1132/m.2368 type:complete len:325 (-) Transcript_1132:673-1647(-)